MRKETEVSISDARKNFPSLVRDAERGLTVTLTRRRKAVAIMISTDRYQAYAKTSVPMSLSHALDDFRTVFDLDELDIETVYEDVRDESEGRAFQR